MKCSFFKHLLLDYNERIVSSELKQCVEAHTRYCRGCRSKALADRALLDYLKEDILEAAVDPCLIMEGIDPERYVRKNISATIRITVRRVLVKYQAVLASAAAMLIILALALHPSAMNSMYSMFYQKAEKLTEKAVVTSDMEWIETGAPDISDEALKERLDALGMGVSPWLVDFTPGTGEIFIRNYASLIKYSNGHIKLSADMKSLDGTYLQGSVVTEVRYNSSGQFAVIGNRIDLYNMEEDYKSGLYMLHTDTGRYFEMGKINMNFIADSWSPAGRYYAWTIRRDYGSIYVCDTALMKMYIIEAPSVKVNQLFISDSGKILAIDDGGGLFSMSSRNGRIEKAAELKGQIVFADADNERALVWQEGMLYWFEFESNGKEYAFENPVVDDIKTSNGRYIAFRQPEGNAGIIDLTDKSVRLFDAGLEASPEFDLEFRSIEIAPDGKGILIYSSQVIAVFEDGRYVIDNSDPSVYGLEWLDNEHLVYAGMKDGPDIKAGDIKITAVNIRTGEKKELYPDNVLQ